MFGQKQKQNTSNTTVFNEWHSTMLHVLIPKETPSSNSYEIFKNTTVLQGFGLYFREISLILFKKKHYRLFLIM